MSQQANEIRFFDEAYRADTRDLVSAFYSLLRAGVAEFERLLIGHCCGRFVLDYGCGAGQYALSLAKCGARVVGIDISPAGIESASARARSEGLDSATFMLMDAEQMQFEDNSFDVLYGVSILHHLDLSRALAGVVRVLKPNGKAIFLEPMGHNPVINLFRKLTPRIRTMGEHPLTMKDLALVGNAFRRRKYSFFHLAALPLVPVMGRLRAYSAARALDRLDSLLLQRLPALAPFAWKVVMFLEEPRK